MAKFMTDVMGGVINLDHVVFFGMEIDPSEDGKGLDHCIVAYMNAKAEGNERLDEDGYQTTPPLVKRDMVDPMEYKEAMEMRKSLIKSLRLADMFVDWVG